MYLGDGIIHDNARAVKDGELKTALVPAVDVECVYGNTVATYSKCSEIKTQVVQFITAT